MCCSMASPSALDRRSRDQEVELQEVSSWHNYYENMKEARVLFAVCWNEIQIPLQETKNSSGFSGPGVDGERVEQTQSKVFKFSIIFFKADNLKVVFPTKESLTPQLRVTKTNPSHSQ